jgi:Tfp pilus assembly protein PilV
MAAEKVIEAFREGKNKKEKYDETRDDMYFYRGNMIAQKLDNGELIIDTCGWKTDTTKDRLSRLGSFSLRQLKGVWYINGKEWNGSKINVNKFLEW